MKNKYNFELSFSKILFLQKFTFQPINEHYLIHIFKPKIVQYCI